MMDINYSDIDNLFGLLLLKKISFPFDIFFEIGYNSLFNFDNFEIIFFKSK